jgi:hypothetical protein
MEHLFSPYADMESGSCRGLLPELPQTFLSAEERLHTRTCTLWCRPVAWLTPHAAVMREHLSALLPGRDPLGTFQFHVDGRIIVAPYRSSAALSEIVDVVLRLVASGVHSVVHAKELS